METLPYGPALAKMAALLAAAALAGGCGGETKLASHSPLSAAKSPSPQTSVAPPSSTTSNSPESISGAYGVLVGPLTGSSYTVSLVAVDGKVVASAQASTPAAVRCGSSAAAVVPLPVSTSDTRAYFMDAQGAIRFLAPSGGTGQATTVPRGTSSRRSMFAVSPDDRRIAVIVDDFTSSGATTRLYVEDLAGGANHVEPFKQSGASTLWPTGWHGTNNLVVAKAPACTQGGGPLSAGPLELHVVDPLTAARRFIIGGPTCVIAGTPSKAGVVCESPTQNKANVENWIASYTMGGLTIAQLTPAYLSPDGSRIAFASGASTSVYVVNSGINVGLSLQACGWIDDTHVFAPGDPQQQARLGDVTSGAIVPIAALGDCGGRIPGGL